MREVNEPTVETLQLLVIEEIEAALKATKTARRRQDRNAIKAVIETQEDHVAELVQTFTEAYFTEADVSGHCHSKVCHIVVRFHDRVWLTPVVLLSGPGRQTRRLCDWAGKCDRSCREESTRPKGCA